MTNKTRTPIVPLTAQEIEKMNALGVHIAAAKIRGFSVDKNLEARFMALANRSIGYHDPA
jgi:hypothetical protein